MTLCVERCAWSDEARDGVRATFNHPEAEAEFREGVESGRLALWRVGDSWAITETRPDAIFVWAYQGHDICAFANGIIGTCRRLGIPCFEFYTARRGLPRLLSAFNPQPLGDGLWRVLCSS